MSNKQKSTNKIQTKIKRKNSLARDPFLDMDESDWADPDVPQSLSPTPEIKPSYDLMEQVSDIPQADLGANVLETEVSDTDTEAEVWVNITETQTTMDEDIAESKIEEVDILSEVTETNINSEVTTLEDDVTFAEQHVSVDEVAPDGQAEADEEVSWDLDEIIATIDTEINQTTPVSNEAPVDFNSGKEQYVIFNLAGTEYAVSINNILEIGHPQGITPVPNVPDWLLGITNLRGDVLSVMDLRTFLGLEPLGFEGSGRMLVVRLGDGASLMATGLIVDRVNEIQYLTVDEITPPAAHIEDEITPYMQGVYEHEDRLLVVLSLDRLLTSAEMQQSRVA